jgi:hypothetical protein
MPTVLQTVPFGHSGNLPCRRAGPAATANDSTLDELDGLGLSPSQGMIAGMLRGRIIAESLRVGAELTVPDLRLANLGRHDVSDSTVPSQPSIWTFVDVEAPDDRADELARALSEALRPEDGWYADFVVGDEHVVVFSGRIFRYSRPDETGRAEAVAYGRRMGTPQHQLDWDD